MKLTGIFRPLSVAPSQTVPEDAPTLTPLTDPITLQRAEAGTLFVGAVALYTRSGEGWPLFAALFLAPDLGMLGYLAGPRVGAATYNVVHAAVLPVTLAAYGLLTGNSTATAAATIWLAHIAFDRLLGYGFKLPSAFGDTHLGRKGRR